MMDELTMVQEFHRKMGLEVDQRVEGTLPVLFSVAHDLKQQADSILSFANGDLRYVYSHMIAEESSEVIQELAAGRMKHAAHELADLIYSCLGLAVALGWDIEAVFDAVHAANMTKERKSTHRRIRKEGTCYVAPTKAIDAIFANYEDRIAAQR